MKKGLREVKKEKNRQAIINAAKKLFAEKGYKLTTLSDIAYSAGVSPRTIFSYFPSKESIIFDQEDKIISELEARLKNKERDSSIFDELKLFSEDVRKIISAKNDPSTERLINDCDELRDHSSHYSEKIEQILLKYVALELGIKETALEPMMVAAAVRTAIDYIHAQKDLDEEELTLILKKVLVFTESGLDAAKSC